jgi:flagellar hook assembly protein FlgD
LVDYTDAILETDETNNVSSDGFSISAKSSSAVLAVTAASASPTSGGQVGISYSLSAPAEVEVRIRNVSGRPVARIAVGAREAGAHSEAWSGLSASGARVPAGAYLCEIVAKTEGGQNASAVAAVRLGR